MNSWRRAGLCSSNPRASRPSRQQQSVVVFPSRVADDPAVLDSGSRWTACASHRRARIGSRPGPIDWSTPCGNRDRADRTSSTCRPLRRVRRQTMRGSTEARTVGTTARSHHLMPSRRGRPTGRDERRRAFRLRARWPLGRCLAFRKTSRLTAVSFLVHEAFSSMYSGFAVSTRALPEPRVPPRSAASPGSARTSRTSSMARLFGAIQSQQMRRRTPGQQQCASLTRREPVAENGSRRMGQV